MPTMGQDLFFLCIYRKTLFAVFLTLTHLFVKIERLICANFVFLVSRDCCVALPCGAMGFSAVCDCGIS